MDDDPLELGRPHGLALHLRVAGCLEQFFHPGFADDGAKATNLAGIARECRRVVVPTAEVLPDDVHRPTGGQFLVAQVEGVFEVKQR